MAVEEKTMEGVPKSGDVDKIGDDEEGVLLYYKFVQILEPEKTKSWLFDLSASLGLLGRIRVAHDGINVTVCRRFTILLTVFIPFPFQFSLILFCFVLFGLVCFSLNCNCVEKSLGRDLEIRAFIHF